MIEDLDQNLNPKRTGPVRVNPESQLEDKSVPYSKLQLSGKVSNTDLADASVTNAKIADDAAISISKTALGTYTVWTDWSPTCTGFSVAPTFNVARYMQLGKTVTVTVTTNVLGTSNATSFTITNFPVAPKYAEFRQTYFVYNNSGLLADHGLALTSAGTTTVAFYKDSSTALNAWTGSGTKGCDFSFSYEVA